MKKIYYFIFILCSLFNYAHSFAQATTGYYVINVGATTSESEASKNAQKLTKEGYASSYLWIPDYASLSGAKYYMFYIGPFKTQNECEVAVQNYRKKNPTAIGLLVSNEPKRVQIAGIGKVTVFDNVKVPKENRIGEDGFGFNFAMAVLNGGRIGIASQALGIAKGAFELALQYSQVRKAFGKEIFKHQAIAFKLADMATEIEAARMLCLKAAWLKDQHMDYNRAGSMAKLFASEVAMKTTIEAVQVHGGYGYVKEYHVERLMRDAKITQIYEGTSEVQKIVISRGLLAE